MSNNHVDYSTSKFALPNLVKRGVNLVQRGKPHSNVVNLVVIVTYKLHWALSFRCRLLKFMIELIFWSITCVKIELGGWEWG